MYKKITSGNAFIFTHLISVCIIYSLFYLFGFIDLVPSPRNLFQWDSFFYFDIAKNGYLSPNSGSTNTAFFPLFSFIIKLIDFNPLTASLFNLLILYIALRLIFKEYKVSADIQLMIVSIPSLMFCMVPYSESTFFLFSTIFLIGFKRDNWKYILIGSILLSMTRTSALVAIPAFLFILFYYYLNELNNKYKYVLYGILGSIIGTSIVYFIQFAYTGIWFANFEVMNIWDRVLSIPSFKLTTWGDFNLLWLDANAYMYFIISFFLLIIISWKSIFKKSSQLAISNNLNIASELYSLCYIFLIGITILIYSPKAYETTTSIFGLNRYIFSTPYFVITLIFLYENVKCRDRLILFSLSFLVLSFQFFTHQKYSFNNYTIQLYDPKYLIYLLMCLIYFLIPVFYQFIKRHYFSIYLVNVILQIYLFTLFIQGKWVG